MQSDQFVARGFWSAGTAYRASSASQPFPDLVVYNWLLNPSGRPTPGFFAALANSTGVAPIDPNTNRPSSSYWQLIRLNQ